MEVRIMATGGVLNYIINFNTGNAMAGFNQVEGALNRMKSAFVSTAGALGLLKIGSLLAEGLKEAADAGWKYDSTMQQAQMQFGVLLRSAEDAKNMLAEMQQYADVTPFQLTDLTQASTMMLAFGIAGDEIMPTLRTLGDISLGSTEKLNHLAYAFSEVASQGQLMSRHVLMMVNSGFNPLQVISEKTGVSMKDLKTAMEEGKISLEMTKEAFRLATAEGGRFQDGMLKASRTYEGQMSTIKDYTNKALGGVVKPLFEAITNQVLPKVVSAFKILAQYLPEIGKAIETNVMPQLTLLLKTFMYFIGLYKGGAGDTSNISGSIQTWTTSIGSAIKGIIVFMEGVRNAYLIIKTLGEGIMAFAAVAKAAFVMIKTLGVMAFEGIWMTGYAFYNGFTGLFLGLADIVQGVVLGISGGFEWAFKSIMDFGRRMTNDLSIAFQNIWNGIADGFATIMNPIISAKNKLTGSDTKAMEYSNKVTTNVYTEAQMNTAGKNTSWDIMKSNHEALMGQMKKTNQGFLDSVQNSSTKIDAAWKEFFDSDTLRESTKTLKDLGTSMKSSFDTMTTAVDLSKVDAFIGQLNFASKVGLGEGIAKSAKSLEEMLSELGIGGEKAAKGASTFVDKFKAMGKEISTQAEKFANFVGLFDRVERKGPSSGEALLRRLQSQAKEMMKWQASMSTLQTRLGPENTDLIEQLRGMGPSAQRQITGLSKLSDSKLQEYARLFGKKASIGFQEAKAVVKYEHSGVILVRGVNSKEELQEIAQIVAQDMERDLNRQSMYAGAGKLMK